MSFHEQSDALRIVAMSTQNQAVMLGPLIVSRREKAFSSIKSIYTRKLFFKTVIGEDLQKQILIPFSPGFPS